MANKEERLPAFKLTIVQYAIVAILLVLLSGLWRLQVIGAQNYRTLAEQNRIRKVPILAPRGKLFDREGRLVVDNYPSVSCFLIREPGRDVRADFPLISRGLHMTKEQLDATLAHYALAPKYQPIPLKQDITPDEVEFIESHRDELPELETIDEQRRLYPRNGFAANLIGYVGEVSDDMLNDPRYAYYEPGDVVGKSGVEQTYDQLLRGQDGSQDIIVDSHGREVGILGREPAVPGQGLKLTIDLDVQRAAEAAMGDRNGAIIAINPHTGQILALVGGRNYGVSQFNHATSERPTGSIFKPFVYAAAYNSSLNGLSLGDGGVFSAVTKLNDEAATYNDGSGNQEQPPDYQPPGFRLRLRSPPRAPRGPGWPCG